MTADPLLTPADVAERLGLKTFSDPRLFTREGSRFIWARVSDQSGRLRRASTRCVSESAAIAWADAHESCVGSIRGRRFIGNADKRSGARWELKSDGRIVARTTGMVYFLVSLDLIKVGFTSGPVQRRLKTIQRMSAAPVSLLHTFPGSRHVEATLHERFASLRSHGEWFRAEDPLMSFVAGLDG